MEDGVQIGWGREDTAGGAERGQWRRSIRHIKAEKDRSAEMMSKSEIKSGWGGTRGGMMISDVKILLQG